MAVSVDQRSMWRGRSARWIAAALIVAAVAAYARYQGIGGSSKATAEAAGELEQTIVALALEPTDPALLHYRSGGFYLARAAQTGRDGVWDVLLGMAAAVD